MKFPFGPIYLAFLVVGAGYELYLNHFSGYAIVNYLLAGFLYSSVSFIVFYILARVAIFVFGRTRHRDTPGTK
jgi:hypothetical protein